MTPQALLAGLVLLYCWVATTDAAGRVVQLITENPSSFVAADPNDPQYLITLSDRENEPSEFPTAAVSRTMLMTDAAGQRYNCSIPGAPSVFDSAEATQQQAPSAAAAAASIPTRSPFELLDSLTGLCLYRQDGLWTYELCHKKHVRQFRQDAAKGKEDFSCGQYNGDEQQTEAVLEDASSSGHHMKYVSHTFSGGADCLLTRAPRTAEVRYTCARGVKENVVMSVREFPTCNYVVVVSTPFLCKHPAFTPPVHDVRFVSCVPVDEDGRAVLQELRAMPSASRDPTDDASTSSAAAADSDRADGTAGRGMPAPDRVAASPAAVPAGSQQQQAADSSDASRDGVEGRMRDEL